MLFYKIISKKHQFAIMIELEGIHGTSSSKADQIRKSKFKIRTGRGGKGAYFWRHNKYSGILAYCWFLQAKYNGRYSGDRDKTFAEIKVKIKVPTNSFLDLEDPDIRENLADFAVSKGIDTDNDRKRMAELIEAFVTETERVLSSDIKVLQLRLPIPHDCRDYPSAMMGFPISYIVRNESIITIIEIKERNNG
jgi:hypothetical protein